MLLNTSPLTTNWSVDGMLRVGPGRYSPLIVPAAS